MVTSNPKGCAMNLTVRQWCCRALWRVVKFLALLAGTWFLAVPQLPIVWSALSALAGVSATMLFVGATLSVAALLADAQLTRTLLGEGRRPGLWHTMGIITTSLGVNRVMPAGAAAGSLVTFRLLERAGVRRPRAVFTMAVRSIGSAIVLNALLWVALVVALPAYGFAASYVLAVAAGATVFAVGAVTTDALYRRRSWLWTTTRRTARLLPKLDPDAAIGHLDDQSSQLRELAARPAMLCRAGAWAAANWLIDAAALWVFLSAFGVTMSPVAVLVAFAVANVAAAAPITPGGLGVVEVTLAVTLTSFGAPPVATALGIAAYRVFNFWLPIPASAMAYLAVRHIQEPPEPAVHNAALGITNTHPEISADPHLVDEHRFPRPSGVAA